MGKPSKRRAQKAVERRRAKRKAGLSIHLRAGFPPIPPAAARSLVEGAVEYAQRCGLTPHHDYRIASRIFSGIESASPDRQFSYGKDGKPFYVSGPRDTPSKSRRIVAALNRTCGPGGFHYLVMLGQENAQTGQEIEPIDSLN